jgi:hypothetical protein
MICGATSSIGGRHSQQVCHSFVSGIAVFVVVLELFGRFGIFVLLAHGCFVLIGPLVSRVVVVIDSTGDWWRNGEVAGNS